MWSWGRLRAAAHIVEQDGHQTDASGWAWWLGKEEEKRDGEGRGFTRTRRADSFPCKALLTGPWKEARGGGFVEKIKGARDRGALLRGGGGDVHKFDD